MTLSTKQRQIAAYWGSDHRWTLVSGPMGSGKSHPATLGLLLGLSRYGGVEAFLASKSWPQIKSMVHGEMETILGEPITIESDGSLELQGAGGLSNRIRCFAAQDRRAEPRIRGFNFVGGLVDEMTTLPPGILAAVNARCRVGEARICGLTNPDGPNHPVKLNYFGNAEAIDAQVITTTLYDNPSLHPSYIDSLKAHYSGHMRERMVYGRWAAATGLVYPRALEFSDKEPDVPMAAYDVTIDVGESSVTCALLMGRTADGHTWVLDEWVYDHSVRGAISEEAQVSMIREHFAWTRSTPPGGIATWTVDPAAKRFRQEIMRQLPHGAQIGKGANEVMDGIQEVNHWFATGVLHIWGERVPLFMSTVGALTYDEERSEMGEDAVVKIPDHLTDCFRYYVLSRAINEMGGRKVWQARRDAMKETAL